MKKILTLLLFAFWVNVSANGVLDSEATDYESESEYCKTLVVENCLKTNISTMQVTYIFNPIQLGGTFQFIPNWYLHNNSLRFIPVQTTR